GTLSYIVIDSENKYVSVEKYNSCPTGALIIPETVNIEDIIYTITSISNFAFYNCSNLTNVNIPDSVTSIGDYAFRSCSSLTIVEVNWQTPLAINSNVFYDLTLGNIALTIPKGTLSSYEVANIWKEFKPISETLSSLDINTENTVQFYPNPVKDMLYITLDSTLNFKQVNIFTVLGKYLYSEKSLTIDVSYLSSGIYIFEVETSQGKTSKKIVKL
ncbi:leucine-rich repeat protein, partial [Flavicella sp.]|uniref:leucine-rich repeat protein n=1 Tax=Flavicella sp. TaxID=2957742 RepID=UPI00301604CA